MQKRATTISLLGLLAIVAVPTRADECFCLSHASGAILRGCESYKALNDAYPTADCTDPETGRKSLQTMYSEWKRIEAGADRCVVCRPPPRAIREVPRSPP